MLFRSHLLIKMPDSVPPNVTASFASLFPGMLTVLIFAAFSFGFESIFKLSVNDAITMCIQVPLSKIITTVPGFIALFMFSNILWSFGIHGRSRAFRQSRSRCRTRCP